MWPNIDAKNKEIVIGGGFALRELNANLEQPICIKEIVMIYADFEQVSYDKTEVPMAVSYDTEYGEHVILFSTVQNLQYHNEGIDWTATYSSDPKNHRRHPDDGAYLPEEILTSMFRNMETYEIPDVSELPRIK